MYLFMFMFLFHSVGGKTQGGLTHKSYIILLSRDMLYVGETYPVMQEESCGAQNQI